MRALFRVVHLGGGPGTVSVMISPPRCEHDQVSGGAVVGLQAVAGSEGVGESADGQGADDCVAKTVDRGRQM
jgi:hypothetical protein